MLKRFFKYIKEFVVGEYKYIVLLLFIYILFTWPVNYYIVIGGGISDVDSRIKVEDSYQSKGSFNLSYVTELQGRVVTYLLSYVISDWERVSIDDYKYEKEENIEDVEFRSDLDLKTANSVAVKHAYKLAGKEYKELNTKFYVVATFSEYDTNLKIQDQILSVNGKRFDTLEEYKQHLQKFNKNDVVKVKVLRDGKKVTVSCKIYEYQGVKILGVSLQKVSDYETAPDVEIEFESDESGPSGGLITTLDIYDKLIKKDLTRALKIAGTGTIEEDGSIGTIGGVEYKLLGAERGDADVFLVPSGENYEECIKIKKEKDLKIKIISVSTIEEAIDKLEDLE